MKLQNTKTFKVKNITLEQRLRATLGLNREYIPDILVELEGYPKLVAIEIFNTHAKDKAHLKELLQNKPIRVYEIRISDMDISLLTISNLLNKSRKKIIFDNELTFITEYNSLVRRLESSTKRETGLKQELEAVIEDLKISRREIARNVKLLDQIKLLEERYDTLSKEKEKLFKKMYDTERKLLSYIVANQELTISNKKISIVNQELKETICNDKKKILERNMYLEQEEARYAKLIGKIYDICSADEIPPKKIKKIGDLIRKNYFSNKGEEFNEE